MFNRIPQKSDTTSHRKMPNTILDEVSDDEDKYIPRHLFIKNLPRSNIDLRNQEIYNTSSEDTFNFESNHSLSSLRKTPDRTNRNTKINDDLGELLFE